MKNTMGDVIPWNYTVEMLKGVPRDQNISDDEDSNHFEVEYIVDHREEGTNGFSYLVKWKGFDNSDNTWVKGRDFDSLEPIQYYWKKRAKARKQKPAVTEDVDQRSGGEGCEFITFNTKPARRKKPRRKN